MKLIECPRDAMQGIRTWIPTKEKIRYINNLLAVGFDTIDFGSFVSSKAIPQMRDTAEVLMGLDLGITTSKLLAIVANVRGAEAALQFSEITYLGYPLSLSETFQQRNTNRSIADAFNDLAVMKERVSQHHRELVVYLSMGFGNPYGDPYEIDYVTGFVERLVNMEINIISVADTVGVSDEEKIRNLLFSLLQTFPALEVGVHLHSTPDSARSKVHAAFEAGCRRIDSAMNGVGGCPMADDNLVGNVATETVVDMLDDMGVKVSMDQHAYQQARTAAQALFNHFA